MQSKTKTGKGAFCYVPNTDGLLRWSPRYDHLGIGCGSQECVRIIDEYDPSHAKEVTTIQAVGHVRDFRFSPDGEKVVVAANSTFKARDSFRVTDLETAKFHNLEYKPRDPPTTVCFVRPDIVAAGSPMWDTVLYYDIRAQHRKEVARLPPKLFEGHAVRQLESVGGNNGDGHSHILVVQHGRSHITDLDIRNNLVVKDYFRAHGHAAVTVSAVAVSPSGDRKTVGFAGAPERGALGADTAAKRNPDKLLLKNSAWGHSWVYDRRFHPTEERILASAQAVAAPQDGKNTKTKKSTGGEVELLREPAFNAKYEPKTLCRSEFLSGGRAISVAWNKDGSKLAYTARNDKKKQSVVYVDAVIRREGVSRTKRPGEAKTKWEMKRYAGSEIVLRDPENSRVRAVKNGVRKVVCLVPKAASGSATGFKASGSEDEKYYADEKGSVISSSSEWEHKTLCSEVSAEGGVDDWDTEDESEVAEKSSSSNSNEKEEKKTKSKK